MEIRRGVTRAVWLVGPVAVKVPRSGRLVRGWLANRSEWEQRRRPDVARPWVTLLHVALVLPRANKIAKGDRFHRGDGDEAKSSSWGRFGDRWLLIDFDRSWQEPRGLVGSLYFGNLERLARKWMKL